MAQFLKRFCLFVFLSLFFAVYWFSNELLAVFSHYRSYLSVTFFIVTVLGLFYLVFTNFEFFSFILHVFQNTDLAETSAEEKSRYAKGNNNREVVVPDVHGSSSTNPPKCKRSVSGYMKRNVAASQNWQCGMCKQLLQASFEVDHIRALCHGGSNDMSNLIALCRNCHGEKTFRERS